MKKFMTIIIWGLFLTACNSQTNDKAVSEPIEQSPTETVFVEYHESDFTDVPVKLNKQDTAPPIAVNSYDLTGIEFEEKLSPCKLPENCDKFLPQIIIEGNNMTFDYSGEPNPKAEKHYYDALLVPTLPSITAEAFDGENLYYIADYDNICGGYSSHCYDIYKYSTETGENTCVYSYSDASADTATKSPFAMMCHNGSLWLLQLDEVYSVFRLDEEKGEFTDFHEFPDASMSSFYQYSEDKLIVAFVDYTETEDDTLTEYTLRQYMDDSGEWSEISKSETMPVMNGGKFITEDVDSRTARVESEDFMLQTEIRGASLKAASENCMTFLSSDSIATIMYTYNLKAKERYVLDVSNLNQYMSVYPMGDNLIMGGANMGHYYYAIPELGSYFSLMKKDDGENVNIHFSDGKTSLIKCSRESEQCTTPDGFIYEPLKAPVLKELVVVG